jgi:hypothetical protein
MIARKECSTLNRGNLWMIARISGRTREGPNKAPHCTCTNVHVRVINLAVTQRRFVGDESVVPSSWFDENGEVRL